MSYDSSTPEHAAKIRAGKAQAAEKRRLELEAKLVGADAPQALILEHAEPTESATEPDDALRSRALEGIDPEIAALFSDEELAKYEAEENQKAAAERKKRALEEIRENMRQRARVSENLIAASVLRSDAEKKRLAELVSFKIDMPNNGAGHNGRNGIRIDGFLYAQGQVYTRPRAVFETLQSIFYKAWLQEITFTTLNQNQPGMSALEVLSRQIPRFEVPRPEAEAVA